MMTPEELSRYNPPPTLYAAASGAPPAPPPAPPTATPVVIKIPGTDIPLVKPPLGASGGGPTGSGNFSNPLGSIGQIGDILGQLSSGTLWLRIGQFLLGTLLLLIGFYLMASESAAGTRLKADAQNTAVLAAATA